MYFRESQGSTFSGDVSAWMRSAGNSNILGPEYQQITVFRLGDEPVSRRTRCLETGLLSRVT